MKQPKIYTPAKFAEKIGIGRATMWRWLNKKHLEKRLKMYDAKKITIAGKSFIEHAAIILMGLSLLSCSAMPDHQYKISQEFPKLKRPIILIGKDCHSSFGCSVIVRDSEGRSLTMGNASSEGPIIGASYNVGDTIK